MMFQVDNLACCRGWRMIFRNIGFTLAAGGALLVTGPNGSGKSSLLRILAGLLPAYQGDMRWNGQTIDPVAHRQRLHYIGHHDAVKLELTVAEMMDYWCALRGRSKIEAVLPPSFGLDELKNTPIRYLSAGQKRRLALARVVTHEVPLWLLDEPATSLDQAGQDLLSELLRGHRLKGGSAIIATHHGIHLPNAQNISFAGKST